MLTNVIDMLSFFFICLLLNRKKIVNVFSILSAFLNLALKNKIIIAMKKNHVKNQIDWGGAGDAVIERSMTSE